MTKVLHIAKDDYSDKSKRRNALLKGDTNRPISIEQLAENYLACINQNASLDKAQYNEKKTGRIVDKAMDNNFWERESLEAVIMRMRATNEYEMLIQLIFSAKNMTDIEDNFSELCFFDSEHTQRIINNNASLTLVSILSCINHLSHDAFRNDPLIKGLMDYILHEGGDMMEIHQKY